MMQLGIFAKTFLRPSLAEILQAVRNAAIGCVQFNLACVGLPTLPSAFEDATCRAIADAMRNAGITMSAISGTFNTIHPDRSVRAAGIERACRLVEKCPQLGTHVVTLCTGTRDRDNMWRHHPDNGTPEAWSDLVATLLQLCATAERHGVTLAIEPEVANVISSAQKARQIIKDVGSGALKVVIDPANLLTRANVGDMANVLNEAITLLAPHIVLAHAKDIDADNTEIRLPAGAGCLDYAFYIRLLREIGYSGPLILHGLAEQEVPRSVEFLQKHLAAAG